MPSMRNTSEQVREVLGGMVNPIVARGALRFALHRCGLTEDELDGQPLTQGLVEELRHGLKVMSIDEHTGKLCYQALCTLVPRQTPAVRPAARAGATRQRAAKQPQKLPTVRRLTQGETIEIHQEEDVVRARGRARWFAQTVGFGPTEQTKVATAVSEVSRNIFVYAQDGTVSLIPLASGRGLRIEAHDRGPGIAELDRILAGEYRSRTGMGLGLLGCKRLMDRFQVETTPGEGTLVIMEKEIA